MKWNTSNFEGLVLGCIDSYDSEKRRIFQHFSSSTWFLCLRTANTSKFQEKNVKLFGRNEMKFHFIPILVDELGHFSAKCWWNFAGISQKLSGNDKKIDTLYSLRKTERLNFLKVWKKQKDWKKFKVWVGLAAFLAAQMTEDCRPS